MVEISTTGDFIEWSKNQNQETIIAISTRSALRVLPTASHIEDDIILSIFHAILVSSSPHIAIPSQINYVHDTLKYAIYNLQNSFSPFRAAVAVLDILRAPAQEQSQRDAASAIFYSANANKGSYFREIWKQVSIDATSIEKKTTSKQLLQEKLWNNQFPTDLLISWSSMKKTLLARDENWQVWTKWYDDRLEGRPFNEALEREKIFIPTEDWEKGAAHVNAIIAEIEARYETSKPTSPPKQRPAVIEAEMGGDGKLHRIHTPPETKDAEQEERLRQAWTARCEALKDLLSLQPGRNDPVLQNILKRYGQALGARFEELNIMALGEHGQRLKMLAAKADKNFLEDIAAEIQAMAANHDLFIRQFSKWRKYLENTEDEKPVSEEVKQGAVSLSQKILQYKDRLSEGLRAALKDLVEDVEAGFEYSAGLARELVNSTENIMAALMSHGLELVKKGANFATQKPIETASLLAAIIAIGQVVPEVLTAASQWAWLQPVLDYIMKHRKP